MSFAQRPTWCRVFIWVVICPDVSYSLPAVFNVGHYTGCPQGRKSALYCKLTWTSLTLTKGVTHCWRISMTCELWLQPARRSSCGKYRPLVISPPASIYGSAWVSLNRSGGAAEYTVESANVTRYMHRANRNPVLAYWSLFIGHWDPCCKTRYPCISLSW